jgi:putative inorganic carbon (HCO3(-)) transporter
MLLKIKQIAENSAVVIALAIFLWMAAIGSYFATEQVWIPLVILAPLFLWILIKDYRIILQILVAALPLAVLWRIEAINLNIGIPSEPLIGIMALLAGVILLFQDRESGIIKHPVSIILLFYWLGLLISLMFSTMPSVSIKTFLVATAYLVVFYYLMAYYFYTNPTKIKRMFLLYGISLMAVVVYTTYQHADYSFNKMYSGFVTEPFFSDHTIYGACLAFMLPVVGVFLFRASSLKITLMQKNLLLALLAAFVMGVYFSFSRASWLSLFGALGMLALVALRIRFARLATFAGIVVVLVLLNMETISPILFKNKNDSKARKANLETQIKSVTNVKNDVSNAERVNRWACALRMFNEKPLTGFGIGTYQFKYIPFQKRSEMTEISITNTTRNLPQGMGGTAHSEYLLALSESGIVAGGAFLLLFIYAVYLGMKLYYTAEGEDRYYALAMLLGLVTYFLHGVFNNFLTTDKAAFLVWAALAVLCVLDIRHRRRNV